jgi:hypothetical protein
MCPHCAAKCNHHDGARWHDRPSHGSLILCWHCAQASVVTTGALGKLRARRCTSGELAELRGDRTYQAVLELRRQALARNPLVHPEMVIAAWRLMGRDEDR